MIFKNWVLLASCLARNSGVIAVPAPQVTSAVDGSQTGAPTACAAIASITDSLLSASPSATPSVPASVAISCLLTVPNKPEPALKLIKSLRAFVQWQSTLPWLKSPPESYDLAPVDILGGLDKIASRVSGDEKYASEYDFAMAIIELIGASHDGHFNYFLDVFKGFFFMNTLVQDLVTISRDGIETPKLYHFSQLSGNSSNGTLVVRQLPPAIVQINGQDAIDVVMQQQLRFAGYQSLDAMWNAGMPSYAAPNDYTSLTNSMDYQGQNLTLTYENGQKVTAESVAIVRRGANFTGVRTGEDFYSRFCNPDASIDVASPTTTEVPPQFPTSTSTDTSTSDASSTSSLPPLSPTISNYPWPVVRDNGSNITSGYFLNGTGYDDVAVLAISSFSSEIDDYAYLVDFQATVATLLTRSREQNKTKLIIDVSENGGGLVAAAYELFAQLFPNTTAFSANNIRESKSLVQISNVSSANAVEIRYADTATFNGTDPEELARFVALRSLDENSMVSQIIPGHLFSPMTGLNLTTSDAILGPVILQNDSFTSYQYTPWNRTLGSFNITGTGNRTNVPPSPFTVENIILLTDGACSSTCATFARLLYSVNGTNNAKIKTVVVGGRPDPALGTLNNTSSGPMQAVGGVAGAQIFYFSNLQEAAQAVLVLSPELNSTTNSTENEDLLLLAEGYAMKRSLAGINGGTRAGAINGKNDFVSLDNLQTPIQFLDYNEDVIGGVNETNYCHFYYTKEMVLGPVKVWERGVDAFWGDEGDDKFCLPLSD
ncbi:peptidase S41 family protein [Cercophora samala]|uniref:Peptidase S41 family protein n=1 Tax=Cercophora samala TaxID=330535 RepID=A0AA39Z3I0_9PEZI|nr:peptidase S41 family protein [Cercophora samala]